MNKFLPMFMVLLATAGISFFAVDKLTKNTEPADLTLTPTVVPYVNITEYAGTWYQISDFPQWYETFCGQCTVANYSLSQDGTYVVVQNSCQNGAGKVQTITGKATPENPQNNKLAVVFSSFSPFAAQYWIVRLDVNYQWAVVSNSNASDLYILSRTRTMEPSLYDSIVQNLQLAGFHTD
jgi:apolipoprotein D and lipocalin family protein